MGRPGNRTVAPPEPTRATGEVRINFDGQTESERLRNEQLLSRVTRQQQTSSLPATTAPTVDSGPQLEALTSQFTDALQYADRLGSEVLSRAPAPSDPFADDEGEMQIGLTRLVIPPERVHVADTTQMLEVPGLRTDSTTVVKTGKGRVSITLEIPFEGAGMINKSLRELIAQFRGYPYVPVVSKYLARIVQPKLQRPIPREKREALEANVEQAAGEIADSKAQFIAQLTLLRTVHPDLATALDASAEYVEAQTQFADIGTVAEINAAFVRVTNVLRQAALVTPTPTEVLRTVDAAVQRLNEQIDRLRFALVNFDRQRSVALQAAIGGLIDADRGLVPCCLDSIQVTTVPDRPKLLRVALSLVYFNPIPYGGTLQYRNIFGQPTTDPQQAVFMQAQVRQWTTAPTTLPPLPGSSADTTRRDAATREDQDLHRETNIRGLGLINDEADLHRSELRIAYATGDMNAEDPAETRRRLGDGYASISEQVQAQVPRWRTLDLSGTRSGVVIRRVVTSLGNRLASQPIPGEFYASMQYLGAKPARATIELAVTNQDVLTEIHKMKSDNQRMSTLGIRHWRRPEIHVRNPVLNLLGIWTAQIEDIVTQSETPNTTSVRLTLVEHRVDPRSSVITRSMLFSQKQIEDALQFLFRHAQAAITAQVQRIVGGEIGSARTEAEADALLEQLNSFLVAQGQDPIFADELTSYLASLTPRVQVHNETSRDLLFGAEDGPSRQGILTPTLIKKAFFLENPKNGAQRLIRERVRARFITSVSTSELSDPNQFAAAILRRYQGKVPTLQDRYPDDRQRLRALGYSEGQINNLVPLPPGTVEVDTSPTITSFAPVAPSSDEILWIAAHLVRSSGNSTDELEFAPTDSGEQVRITSRSGEDKTADVQALIRLAQAVLHNEVQPPGETSLHDLILGSGTTVQDFLSLNVRDFPSLLYRDLRLPVYGDALGPVLDAIVAHRQNKNAERGVTDEAAGNFTSFKELTAEEQALIRRFVPSYREMGLQPRTDQETLEDFAFDMTDTALPDFPFFGRSRQEFIQQFKGQVDQLSRRGEDSLKRTDRQGETLPNIQSDPLNQYRVQKFFDEDRIGRKESPQTGVGTEVATLAFENSDQLLTEAYTPARFRANTQDFGVDTPQAVRDIFDAATALEGDHHLKMLKCFPTFRVFFIEEDQQDGSWRAIDDVYGYNSVVELDVTRHKYQPDLATLTLLNLEGTLETDQFSTVGRDTPEGAVIQDATAEHGVRATKLSASQLSAPVERETGERILRKFPLREGTRIMIQLGYSSRPDQLHIVFTGKIAEVTMGDFVKILAQDYTDELLVPVVENPSTESTSGLIELMMDKPTVEHFGRRTPFSHERLSQIELQNARNTGFLSGVNNRLGDFYADPRLRNVFVAKYSNWWTKTASQLLFEESWDAGGGQKTAWDVIQEVINYSPGYIAAVVPYDLEATLFVGRPEQPYFWTDGLRIEEQRFLRTRARLEQRAKAGAQQLIDAFQKSRFFHGDIRNQAELERRITGQTSRQEEILQLGLQYPYWTFALQSLSTVLDSMGSPPNVQRGAAAPVEVRARESLEQLSRLPAGDYLAELLATLGSTDVDWPRIARVLVATLQGNDAAAGFLRPERVQAGLGPRASTAQTLLKEFFDEAISAQGALQGIPHPIRLFSEIWDGEQVTPDKIQRAIAKQGGDWRGLQTATVSVDRLMRFLYLHRAYIPVFLKQLDKYFKADPLTATARRIGTSTKKWPLNPRMRPFRQYHLLSSFEDIIDNQIACTRGAMWNGVAISTGGGTPLVLWADDAIVKGDRKLQYFTEPNADLDLFNVTSLSTPPGDFVANQYLVAFSRLAQGLRRSYRGQLVCRGRPDIKPWDISYVYDAYNLVFGPVEVERVTHHFSAETGFVTTIVPEMVAIPNNHVDSLRVMQTGWLFGGVAAASVLLIGGLLTGGLLWLGAGAVTAVGLGVGAAAGGRIIADEVLQEGTGTGIVGNFMGRGLHGGLRLPVKIMPLMRQGTPWVAALRGYGRSKDRGFDEIINLVYERLDGKVQDVGRALEFLWKQAGDARQGLADLERRYQENPNLGEIFGR